MSSEQLADFVSRFREEEKDHMHTAVVLIGDAAAQKLVSAWSTSPVQWKLPESTPPEDMRELWDWVWSGVKIDMPDLSKRTGLPVSRLQGILETLRSNRLIYPDGTAANHAIGVLKAEVMKTIKNIKK